MRINKKLLLILLFFTIIPLVTVRADKLKPTFEVLADDSEAIGTDPCDTGACAWTFGVLNSFWDDRLDAVNYNGVSKQDRRPIYGVRITIVDKDGNIVPGGNSINFWVNKPFTLSPQDKNYFFGSESTKTSSSAKDIINEIKSKENRNLEYVDSAKWTMYASNINEEIPNSGINIYLPENGQLSEDFNPYSKWLDNFDIFGQTIIDNILTEFKSLRPEFDKSKQYSYYFKVEPIYVVRELYYNYNYFDAGTSLEILNFMNRFSDSYGCGYVAGGDGECQVGGTWNVIRDEIVSIYFPCSSKPSGELSSVGCFTGNITGKSVGDIVSLYKNGNGLGVGYIRLSDYLSGCESDFNYYNNDGTPITMGERVSIYLKYLNHPNPLLNRDNKAMLNEKNDSAGAACNNSSCNSKRNSTISCFGGSYKSTMFGLEGGHTDLSCYNYDYFEESENIAAFCDISFELNNKYTFNSPFVSKAGQLLFKNITNDGVFSDSSIKAKCYAYQKNSYGVYVPYNNTTRIESDFGDLIADFESATLDVSIEDVEKLENEYVDETYSEVTYNSLGSNVFEFKKNVNFKFSKVYSRLISGESIGITESNKTELDKEIGYGLFSKFDTDIDADFDFSYKFEFPGIPEVSKTDKCNYKIYPEIVDPPELKLEFRSIDTDSPFLDKDGNSRKVGSNWSINYTGDKDLLIGDVAKFLKMVREGTNDLKYDYTGDGVVNDADVFVLFSHVNGRCELKEGVDNSFNNCLVEGVMLYTNDSYDKNGKGPLYKITLTPDTILKIREYNKTNKYDDLNLSKNPTTGTYVSNFLNELESGRVNGGAVTGTFQRFVVE